MSKYSYNLLARLRPGARSVPVLKAIAKVEMHTSEGDSFGELPGEESVSLAVRTYSLDA